MQHITARASGVAYLAALLFFMLTAVTHQAFAHTRLISSEPAANVVLAAAPSRVILRFSAPPEKGFSELQWSLADSGTWHSLKVQQQSTQLGAALPVLAPGRYKIRWSVLSRDGHRQRGVLRFQID